VEGYVLPKGMEIVRAYQQQECHELSYTSASLQRKYKKGACEVSFYNLPKGRTQSILQPVGRGSCKTYCILSGGVTLIENGEHLGPGDVIILSEGEGVWTIATSQDTVIIVHGMNCSDYDLLVNSSEKLGELLCQIQRKDRYTQEHSNRVSRLVQKFAPVCGYSGAKFLELNAAAWYHDIGKVYICDTVLKKEGLFSEVEFIIMQRHATLAKDVLVTHFNERVYEIVSQHHERLDGSGYPNGLKGEEICEEARIIAICDSFDAMTTDRVYKKGMDPQKALHELKRLAGVLYDAHLVEMFTKLVLSSSS